MDIETKLKETFADASAEGYLHAREIDGQAEVAFGADTQVVTASVFKIPICLELARQAATGDLELTERVKVAANERTFGPTGLSGMLDEVELSLRDLANLMMTVSDNTATDVIVKCVGLDRINSTLASLGLTETFLTGDCKDTLFSLIEDLKIDPSKEPPLIGTIDPELLKAARALRAETTSRTTPREITRLLELIWQDEAGPPEACAEVRRIMALQVWSHRMTAGFPDGVKLSAKTGTLPGIRNEAGVIEYPDGGRYAVGVFTVAHSYDQRLPAIDAVIGTGARLAVDHLRSKSN